jgi:hypothetical protein
VVTSSIGDNQKYPGLYGQDIIKRRNGNPAIPLFGKTRESGKTAPVLVEKKAVEIVGQIDYFLHH